MTPSTTTMPGDESWQPYNPVEGSWVELLADGSFRLDGNEATFTPSHAVAETNPTFSAHKEAGEGKTLYLTFHQGHARATIAVRFNSVDQRWYRRDDGPLAELPVSPGTPTGVAAEGITEKAPIREKLRRLFRFSRLPGDGFFKVAFFLFLGWYVFVYHGVFRGQSPDDELLLDDASTEVAAPSSQPSTGTEAGKGDTILYDGGYNKKPPGWE